MNKLDNRSKHKPYYMIPGFIKMAGMTVESVSKQMNMNPITFRRKMNGASDFTYQETIDLAKILKQDKNYIFLTSDV